MSWPHRSATASFAALASATIDLKKSASSSTSMGLCGAAGSGVVLSGEMPPAVKGVLSAPLLAARVVGAADFFFDFFTVFAFLGGIAEAGRSRGNRIVGEQDVSRVRAPVGTVKEGVFCGGKEKGRPCVM